MKFFKSSKDLYEDNLYEDDEYEYDSNNSDDYLEGETDPEECIVYEDSNTYDEDSDYNDEEEEYEEDDNEDEYDYEDEYEESSNSKPKRKFLKKKDKVELTEEEILLKAEKKYKIYKRTLIVIVSLVLTLIASKLLFTFVLNKDDVLQLRLKYKAKINDKNIMDTELKDTVPRDYDASLYDIVEHYAIDSKLKEKGIEFIGEVPGVLTDTEQFKSLTYGEQRRTIDNYLYKTKRDILLRHFLEYYRSDSSTTIEANFILQVVKTSSGEEATLTLNSSTIKENTLVILDSLSVGESTYNIEIEGTQYTSVTLSDKEVNYTYSDESILEAKRNMDLELNNIIATFIITESE